MSGYGIGLHINDTLTICGKAVVVGPCFLVSIVSLVASARVSDPLVRTSARIVRPVVGNLVASFSVCWCPHGICKQSSVEEDFGAVVAVLLLIGPDRVGVRV